MKLQGKVAVVTGASRGIGKGAALALGELGATVYVTGRTVTPGKGLPAGSEAPAAPQGLWGVASPKASPGPGPDGRGRHLVAGVGQQG